MFIERINELLKEKNLKNYKELARAINIPPTTIYNWKNHLPTGEYLITLANYFDVTIDYLVGRSDDIGLIKTNANLTELESSVLALFRKITPKEQARVYGMIKAYVG